MKHLLLFENFEHNSYKGCGCCSVCTGKEDCVCGCPECISLITEKNVPTNSELWSQCKSWVKSKYDVWPSAYAVGAASKRYKSKGGKWKKK
jgi:hypothetical protein